MLAFSALLTKTVKLAAKSTGFVSLVGAINVLPVAAYQHFGRWNEAELESGIKEQQCRPVF